MLLSRRSLLLNATLVTAAPAGLSFHRSAAGADLLATPDLAQALRTGAVVAAFRHAYAPGTFDPPGFTLEQCATQRNLDDAGRAQAGRIGAWFAAQGLQPSAVRSSPWCRCLETATLAFGTVERWDALGSVRAGTDAASSQVAALRQALAKVPPGRFEVWISHQFTLSALLGESTASGEGLVLRATPGGGPPTLLGRLPPA
ncbi:histidine phosphatase family protein [Methylibium sp.]|uniref:histidine phosphatase family protein n=1 Tax=Methylibium sp. TaxID=2067992 RepID=UPI003D11C2C0